MKYATPEERQEARRAQQRAYAARNKELKHEIYERGKKRKQDALQNKANAAWMVVEDPDHDIGLCPGLMLCPDEYSRGIYFGTFTNGTILKNIAEDKTYRVVGEAGREQSAVVDGENVCNPQ